MSYPVGRLKWTPAARGMAHVVIEDHNGAPQLCGLIQHEWLVNVTMGEWSVDVALARVSDCDHAGTYRAPRSAWTGELVDEPRP